MDIVKENGVKMYPKELKKGMIVMHYGWRFLITEDAKNYGQQSRALDNFVGNDSKDVWAAPCKCIEPKHREEKDKEIDWLLRNYKSFQANSISNLCKVLVIKK